MDSEKTPLPLPDKFDPEVNLPGREENGKVFHATIPGMNLAGQLIEHGTPLDMERAEKVLDAVFESQERRPGAPHYGNFTWEREDEMVEDLNAVHFTVMPLIKVMLGCGVSVPASLRDKALEGIRLGLEAIARIDVQLRYTTIAAAEVFDTCIGGELLNDAAIMARSATSCGAGWPSPTARARSTNTIARSIPPWPSSAWPSWPRCTPGPAGSKTRWPRRVRRWSARPTI